MDIQSLKSTFQFVEPLLVRTLREQLSQTDFSRQLGYEFNIVNRWENRRRRLYWDDFLLLCKVKKVDLREVLFDLTGHDFKRNLSSKKIIKTLSRDPASRKVLSASISSSRLSNLESGRVRLLFSEWVAITEALFGRAYRFLNHFFEMNRQPEFSGIFANREEYSKLLGKDPMIGVVKMVLSLQPYKALKKHRSATIAKLTGLEVDRIEQILQALQRCGVTRWNGTHYEDSIGAFDTRTGGREASHDLQAFWRHRIVEHNKKSLKRDGKFLSAFLVYKTSADLEKKVFDLSAKYYNELRSLVESSSSEDHQTIRYVGIEFLSVLENWKLLYPKK